MSQLLEIILDEWAKPAAQRRSAAAMNYILDGFTRIVADVPDLSNRWAAIRSWP
jgi:hypothetical protein